MWKIGNLSVTINNCLSIVWSMLYPNIPTGHMLTDKSDNFITYHNWLREFHHVCTVAVSRTPACRLSCNSDFKSWKSIVDHFNQHCPTFTIKSMHKKNNKCHQHNTFKPIICKLQTLRTNGTQNLQATRNQLFVNQQVIDLINLITW